MARSSTPHETLDGAAARAWVDAFIAGFDAQQARLGELDRLTGDGDFGANIAAALEHAAARLRSDPPSDAAGVFDALLHGFLRVGGTSGPLLAVFFQKLSAAMDGREPVDAATLAAGAADGTAAIRRLGGAAPGDKTMVDALVPATDALAEAAATGASVRSALAAASAQARRGAQATESMAARRGRASYIGQRSTGVVDPGAELVALLFEAGAAEVGA